MLRRALFAAVGLGLLAVSIGGAWLVVVGYAFRLAKPPHPVTVKLALGTLVVVMAYASYRLGTAPLLAGLEIRELPRRQAPSLYRRRDRLCAELGIEPLPLFVADVGVLNALSLGGHAGA